MTSFFTQLKLISNGIVIGCLMPDINSMWDIQLPYSLLRMIYSSGLKNDCVKETFPLRHKLGENIFPVKYIKIGKLHNIIYEYYCSLRKQVVNIHYAICIILQQSITFFVHYFYKIFLKKSTSVKLFLFIKCSPLKVWKLTKNHPKLWCILIQWEAISWQ